MRKIVLFLLLGILIYYIIGIKGILILLGIYFIFFFCYKKRYWIRLITGQTGAGKTLLANHLAQQYIKQGKNVYTTFACQGAKKLPVNFYTYSYPKDSLLIIDESQIGLDARELNKLVKSGASNDLLSMLSMHRHNKLDIFFITQNAEEVDVRVRRYANNFIRVKNIIYFRRIKYDKKEKKLKFPICPLLIRYESWESYSDYERWRNNSAEFSPKHYGATYKWVLTLKRSYSTYSTYQEDDHYKSLNIIDNIDWKNFNELLHTKLK